MHLRFFKFNIRNRDQGKDVMIINITFFMILYLYICIYSYSDTINDSENSIICAHYAGFIIYFTYLIFIRFITKVFIFIFLFIAIVIIQLYHFN